MRCREDDIVRKRLSRSFEKPRFFCPQGKSVSESCRQIGVTDNTYYRWRKQHRRAPHNQQTLPSTESEKHAGPRGYHPTHPWWPRVWSIEYQWESTQEIFAGQKSPCAAHPPPDQTVRHTGPPMAEKSDAVHVPRREPSTSETGDPARRNGAVSAR